MPQPSVESVQDSIPATAAAAAASTCGNAWRLCDGLGRTGSERQVRGERQRPVSTGRAGRTRPALLRPNTAQQVRLTQQRHQQEKAA